MKLDIAELDFIKECIFNSTIKGKDSIFVGGLVSKIFKEVEKLKSLEEKKEVSKQVVVVQSILARKGSGLERVTNHIVGEVVNAKLEKSNNIRQ